MYDSKDILIDNDIFILQFPQGKDLSFSHGIIKSIKDSIIVHNASTEEGSSGSPVIRRSDKNYVIGLHFGGKKKKNKEKKNIYTI
jgi:V8-like Glu-specific endopeptidase